jgi:glycerol-3-phosphate dehydrogenase (NAD(P)+)
MRAVVVGAGSWGSAMAALLADRGHEVAIACRRPEQAEAIAATGRNPDYLREADLSGVLAVPLSDAPVPAADLVVLAVPTRALAPMARYIAPRLDAAAIALNLAKGLEPGTGRRLSAVLRTTLLRPQQERIAVLTGPNHAEEIAAGRPAAAVVAATGPGVAEAVQGWLTGPMFRVYVNEDLAGVELGGAAKNVVALAAGMVDGLGLGDNAKAAVITRGLAEIARLGAAIGARPATLAGLAGLGDLIATCTSANSRNRLAGELLAQGLRPPEVEPRIGMVAEGLVAAYAVRDLARLRDVDVPITEAVVRVLDEETTPGELVEDLMSRDPTAEG